MSVPPPQPRVFCFARKHHRQAGGVAEVVELSWHPQGPGFKSTVPQHHRQTAHASVCSCCVWAWSCASFIFLLAFSKGKKKEKGRMKDRELATIPCSKYKIMALKFSF